MTNTEKKTYQSKGFMSFQLDDDFDLAYQITTINDILSHYPEAMQDAVTCSETSYQASCFNHQRLRNNSS